MLHLILLTKNIKFFYKIILRVEVYLSCFNGLECYIFKFYLVKVFCGRKFLVFLFVVFCDKILFVYLYKDIIILGRFANFLTEEFF